VLTNADFIRTGASKNSINELMAQQQNNPNKKAQARANTLMGAMRKFNNNKNQTKVPINTKMASNHTYSQIEGPSKDIGESPLIEKLEEGDKFNFEKKEAMRSDKFVRDHYCKTGSGLQHISSVNSKSNSISKNEQNMIFSEAKGEVQNRSSISRSSNAYHDKASVLLPIDKNEYSSEIKYCDIKKEIPSLISNENFSHLQDQKMERSFDAKVNNFVISLKNKEMSKERVVKRIRAISKSANKEALNNLWSEDL